LWEAFLLQMNDFDRFLEIELREMLDPVVATQPPRRGGRKNASRPVLTVVAPDVSGEPAMVTVPIATAPQL
jgi:hypothetical protein